MDCGSSETSPLDQIDLARCQILSSATTRDASSPAGCGLPVLPTAYFAAHALATGALFLFRPPTSPL